MENGAIIKYPNMTPVRKSREQTSTTPLVALRSFSYKPGFTKSQISLTSKGKAIIKPKKKLTIKWTVSCSDNSLVNICGGITLKQVHSDSQQKNLKVGKSDLVGPRMMVSKINFFWKKIRTVAVIT